MGESESRERIEEGDLSRREFLDGRKVIAGAALVGLLPIHGLAQSPPADPPGSKAPPGPLPRRKLGRTGVEVSVLGLGTATMGEGPQDVEECASVFAEAIDRGISYVDTARIYGDAETALGRVLKTRRDKIFLATKSMTDTREEAQKSFEQSLRELGVDHVDLLHLHSCGDRDLDKVLGPGGAWEYLLEQKKKGKARFLGITGHNRPEKFLRMLKTDQVDVMMVAMNFVDRHTYNFEETVLPEARKRGVGVMAMKVFGGIQGGFKFNRMKRPSQMDPIHLQIAVRYALSLEGVTGAVIGVQDVGELEQNMRYVLGGPPLSAPELAALESHGKRIAKEWGPRFGPVSANA